MTNPTIKPKTFMGYLAQIECVFSPCKDVGHLAQVQYVYFHLIKI